MKIGARLIELTVNRILVNQGVYCIWLLYLNRWFYQISGLHSNIPHITSSRPERKNIFYLTITAPVSQINFVTVPQGQMMFTNTYPPFKLDCAIDLTAWVKSLLFRLLEVHFYHKSCDGQTFKSLKYFESCYFHYDAEHLMKFLKKINLTL